MLAGKRILGVANNFPISEGIGQASVAAFPRCRHAQRAANIGGWSLPGSVARLAAWCWLRRLSRRLPAMLRRAVNLTSAWKPAVTDWRWQRPRQRGLRPIKQQEMLVDGSFLSLLGLPRFPDQIDAATVSEAVSPGAIRRTVRTHDQLRQTLWRLPQPPSSLMFDLDSVVLTLYGKQQGAQVGYNPKKHGRRSYHPLLCFEAQRQEFWHATLRPGDAASNTGVVPFMRRCLAKVPGSIARRRIRVRADAGFFGHRFVESLNQTGCGYVIVARESRRFGRRPTVHGSILCGWDGRSRVPLPSLFTGSGRIGSWSSAVRWPKTRRKANS